MISWEQAALEYRKWNEHGEYIRADAIRLLIIHSLPVTERQAYKFIKGQPGISTANLGIAMAISNQHAWDVARRLEALHLVSCTRAKGGALKWRMTLATPQTQEG